MNALPVMNDHLPPPCFQGRPNQGPPLATAGTDLPDMTCSRIHAFRGAWRGVADNEPANVGPLQLDK